MNLDESWTKITRYCRIICESEDKIDLMNKYKDLTF